MEESSSRWANMATIGSFALYVILTLADKWEKINDVLGGSPIIFKASVVVLIFAIIFAGIAVYTSNNKPHGKRVRIIKNPQGYHYLVEGNTCYHIPDPDTFNYLGNFFGFTWEDAQLILADDIKRKLNIGKTLPSIRTYFPTIELVSKPAKKS